jgi:hypothetical protein
MLNRKALRRHVGSTKSTLEANRSMRKLYNTRPIAVTNGKAVFSFMNDDPATLILLPFMNPKTILFAILFSIKVNFKEI